MTYHGTLHTDHKDAVSKIIYYQKNSTEDAMPCRTGLKTSEKGKHKHKNVDKIPGRRFEYSARDPETQELVFEHASEWKHMLIPCREN